MDAKEFLKKTVKEKNNVFFSAIRMKRAIDLRNRKASHSWKGQNYKIYPSSIDSLFMCPKEYVEVLVHKAPSFDISSVYKMELGKIVHSMVQDGVLEGSAECVVNDVAESYLEDLDSYIRHMYKQEASKVRMYNLLYPRPHKLSQELEEKLSKSWPEIPGYDEFSGMSFRCDLVINLEDRPAILEIKTTSIAPSTWMGQLDKLPPTKYKLQARFYRYFFNKHKYYDKKIHKVGIAYVNMLMDAGSEDSEQEFWYDFGEEEDTEIEELVTHLGIQRTAYMTTGAGVECTYSKCKEHGNA